MSHSTTRKLRNRMTIPEFAEVMECSERKAYRIAESGRFDSFKIGSEYFISRAAVQAWIDGKSTATRTPSRVNPFIQRREKAAV